MLDPLETRSPEERAATQFALLRALLLRAVESAPGWARLLDGVDTQAVDQPAALARLPVLRKSALTELQAANPPFGGLATWPLGHDGGIQKVFASPGPIYEPGMDSRDWWRFARALRAAGLSAGDVLLICFAYHFTPAGAMLESGARALGVAVIPGGTGNTDQQVEISRTVRPSSYVGTPDFLKAILDRAEEKGSGLDCFRHASVTGGVLFPSLRQEYADRGIACLQCYATADLGLIAYESSAQEGMILDEHVIVEIVRPGTGDPVPEGDVGEVLVTTLNEDYPLIRFATGDLSAFLPGQSPCGRTGPRIKGWMGRADQTTKIRGMLVYPSQVAEIARRHPEIGRTRLTVTRSGERDAFELLCECDDANRAAADKIAESIRNVLKLRGGVKLVGTGTLPNDGKVIADERDYGGGQT